MSSISLFRYKVIKQRITYHDNYKQFKFNVMKKVNLFLAGALFLLVSMGANAQARTGFEYFKGRWNVVASAPTGDVKLIIGFEKSDEKIIGTIKDSDGKEMYKVVSTTLSEKQAIIRFIGSQGEVNMVLNKKDEETVTGDVMDGMATVTGNRIK